MLDLRRDLYARLVVSSHKDKPLNKPFRVSHVDFREPSTPKAVMLKTPFEEKISAIDVPLKHEMLKSRSSPVEKIDETVERVIHDPVLAQINIELEFAEELLKKIKVADEDNPKIPIIENTVVRLRLLLEQKMYI